MIRTYHLRLIFLSTLLSTFPLYLLPSFLFSIVNSKRKSIKINKTNQTQTARPGLICELRSALTEKMTAISLAPPHHCSHAVVGRPNRRVGIAAVATAIDNSAKKSNAIFLISLCHVTLDKRVSL